MPILVNLLKIIEDNIDLTLFDINERMIGTATSYEWLSAIRSGDVALSEQEAVYFIDFKTCAIGVDIDIVDANMFEQ